MKVRACYIQACLISLFLLANASKFVASMSDHRESYKVTDQVSQTADQHLATTTDNNQASFEVTSMKENMA